MTRVMGLDPGTCGAIATIDTDARPRVRVYPLPSLVLRIGNKNRTRLDLDACWLLLLGLTASVEPHMAFLEDVNGFGGNPLATAASGGVLMSTAGALEMALIATQTPRQKIAPSVWKKAFKLKGGGKEGKNASRLAASQLFPESAELFSRVKDDGPAEAVLIAHYGLTHILGYTP